MIFDELKNVNNLTLPIAKRIAFEKIHAWLKGVKELMVDEDYLDVTKPDHVHFIMKGSTVTMLSRRKLNEERLGKHLIYHPKKPRTLKLKHILEEEW
jgi:hypothetical protein